MNENLNEVILRPRFKIELNKDNISILNAFDDGTKVVFGLK